MPSALEIFFKYFWLIGILDAFFKWRFRRIKSKKFLANHPELTRLFARLTNWHLLWINIPWIVMGIGCLFGQLTVKDYLQPQVGNIFVLAWYVTDFVLVILCFRWLVFKGGAELLCKFPSFFNFPANPKRIKWLSGLSIIGMVIWTVVMFTNQSPIPYWKTVGPDYTTVFVVYDGFWRVVAMALLPLAVGLGVLIASIIWFRRLNLPNWWNRKETVAPGFLFFWSVMFLTGVTVGFGWNLLHQSKLVSVFRNGQAQVVEGNVHVLRQQPATGHTDGDLVEVGGKQFVVDYFTITAAYSRTIAYGGVLQEGRFVRICYYNGEILAIDVRQ